MKWKAGKCTKCGTTAPYHQRSCPFVAAKNLEEAMKIPEGLKVWSVDSVYECLTFGDRRQRVQLELMAAAPKAYEEEVAMGSIWRRLTEPVQVAIAEAYELR